MTYEALADRVDGELLTATYLNALTRNTAHCYGLANQPNMAFQGYVGNIASMSKTTCSWLIRHQLAYLHYNIQVDGDIASLAIKASLVNDTGTVTLYSNAAPGTTHHFYGYVDVTANLTATNWYKYWIEFTYDDSPSTHTSTVWDLYESDKTSLGTKTLTGYTRPEEWTDTETVTHTKINTYKTSLDAIRTVAGDDQFIMATRYNNTYTGTAYRSGFWFIHRKRWLHFVGSQVEIVDPTGVFTSVEETSSPFDLYSVSWLADGMLYEVKDCFYCVEDDSP